MDNKILATVNGVNITDYDLNKVIARYPQDRRGFLTTEQGRKQLLSEMVSFELMYNKGKELNYDNMEDFQAQLEDMKKELLTQYTINKLFESVRVSPEEVKKHYEENRDSFNEPPMVSAKHILVETEEKAKDIYSDINNGTISFEDAAVQYSSCPSKEQGGDLGQFSRGMMVPEFENAAFEMNVGDISEPVKTQFGWHLIKLEDKTSEAQRDFSEVQGQVMQQLLQEKQTKKFTDMIQELHNRYDVKIY